MPHYIGLLLCFQTLEISSDVRHLDNYNMDTNTLNKNETKVEVTTTTFLDDANVRSVEHSVTDTSDDIKIKDQTIADFLSKPYLVDGFAWTTASVKNTNLMNLSISSLFSTVTIWQNKLKGYDLVRGTACIKVVLNANPFQQGKLLLSFLPGYGSMSNLSTSYVPMRNYDMTVKSQRPSLLFGPEDGAAVMKMPFVSPYNWYSMSSLEYSWGNYFLDVVSPLAQGTGSSNVDISIYVWFEDIEVASPFIPESSMASKKRMSRPKAMLASKGKDKETVAMASGPVSSALSMAGKVAGTLSAIPVLTPIMEPASWVANGLAGIASFFGYSKPLVNKDVMYTTLYDNRYLTVSDGPDIALPHGLICDNKVPLRDDCSYTDKDEMSFNYLKQVPFYLSTFTFQQSDVSDASLYSLYVSPRALINTSTFSKGTKTVTLGTSGPLGYLSTMFNYYRGSFKVRIYFVKTAYHSGRVQISWSPNPYGTAMVAPNVSNVAYVYREIVDLREKDYIELTLPFIQPVEYLPIDSPSGLLSVKVVNELKNPDTASTSIEGLVFFMAGDDFEFQGPVAYNKYQAFSPESGTGDALASCCIGNSEVTYETVDHAQRTFGEMFTSVRQLLLRNNILYRKSITNANNYSIWPWFVSAPYVASNALQSPNLGGDNYNMIAPMYAFFRGSMDVTCEGLVWTTLCTLAAGAAQSKLYLVGESTTRFVTSFLGNNSIAVDWTLKDTTNIQTMPINSAHYNARFSTNRVPYYSPTKCSPVVVQTAKTNNTYWPNYFPSNFMSFDVFTSTWSGRCGRNIADDFQFTYFVGCPPLLVVS